MSPLPAPWEFDRSVRTARLKAILTINSQNQMQDRFGEMPPGYVGRRSRELLEVFVDNYEEHESKLHRVEAQGLALRQRVRELASVRASTESQDQLQAVLTELDSIYEKQRDYLNALQETGKLIHKRKAQDVAPKQEG